MNKPVLSDEKKQELANASVRARQRAYAPYSKYKVGAALLTETDKVYEGLNIENASYGATVCAERVAIFNAVTEGEKKFTAMAIAAEEGGTPCGLCRQVMAEFGLEIILLLVNKEGKIVRETTVSEILPDAFTPAKLGIDPSAS